MRLALVSHSPWLGGAERCLLELAEALAGRHEVHVVLPGDGARRGALPVPAHVARARWWARDPGRPWRPPDLPGAVRVARVLRRLAPDVVLSNSLVAPAGALAARALRLPHLWWVHEHGDPDHGYRFALGRRATFALVRRLSDAVLVSSDGVAPRFPGCERVPYAIPTPAGAVRETLGTPPRLAIVGRVRETKGQLEAVRALADVPGALLDVVGDGELDAVRALASDLGLAGRVRVHGPTDDPVAAFDAADVVLLCSRDEAFGRVVVEAQKRGRPVVAARSPGVPVVDGETGLSYPPGDTGALAAAIRSVLDDDALRVRLARAGQAHALASYTPEHQADAVLTIAERVAAR